VSVSSFEHVAIRMQLAANMPCVQPVFHLLFYRTVYVRPRNPQNSADCKLHS
jgi:hypothetical protein